MVCYNEEYIISLIDEDKKDLEFFEHIKNCDKCKREYDFLVEIFKSSKYEVEIDNELWNQHRNNVLEKIEVLDNSFSWLRDLFNLPKLSFASGLALILIFFLLVPTYNQKKTYSESELVSQFVKEYKEVYGDVDFLESENYNNKINYSFLVSEEDKEILSDITNLKEEFL